MGNEKMPITKKGLMYLLVGLLVMVAGYILMIGGGSKDPAVFNYAMFDFRRLVAAPIVIICGIIIEIVSIMKYIKIRRRSNYGMVAGACSWNSTGIDRVLTGQQQRTSHDVQGTARRGRGGLS